MQDEEDEDCDVESTEGENDGEGSRESPLRISCYMMDAKNNHLQTI